MFWRNISSRLFHDSEREPNNSDEITGDNVAGLELWINSVPYENKGNCLIVRTTLPFNQQ